VMRAEAWRVAGAPWRRGARHSWQAGMREVTAACCAAATRRTGHLRRSASIRPASTPSADFTPAAAHRRVMIDDAWREALSLMFAVVCREVAGR